MQNYETMMVLTTTIDEEQTAALVQKFQSLIAENGTVVSTDIWGKRRLAYQINHQSEGYYVLITFTSEPDFVAELTRIYNITDTVLRSIVVRLEELPKKTAEQPEQPEVTEVAPEAEPKTEE